jgi:hypothetical protein
MSIKTNQELFESYQQSVSMLSSTTDFYEYEKQFVSLHNEFGKQMLEQSILHTASERKKKLQQDLVK